jgi:sec-independent protein translocase protein TatB
MFDISFTELLVIGVIALIVIGPERLPKVARTMGLLFGRAQRYVNEVKADINNQLKLEELRKIEADLRAKAQNAEHVIIEETQRTEQEFRSAAELAAPAATETAAPQPEAQAPVPEGPAPSSPQLELGLDTARAQAEQHTK